MHFLSLARAQYVTILFKRVHTHCCNNCPVKDGLAACQRHHYSGAISRWDFRPSLFSAIVVEGQLMSRLVNTSIVQINSPLFCQKAALQDDCIDLNTYISQLLLLVLLSTLEYIFPELKTLYYKSGTNMVIVHFVIEIV